MFNFDDFNEKFDDWYEGNQEAPVQRNPNRIVLMYPEGVIEEVFASHIIERLVSTPDTKVLVVYNDLDHYNKLIEHSISPIFFECVDSCPLDGLINEDLSHYDVVCFDQGLEETIDVDRVDLLINMNFVQKAIVFPPMIETFVSTVIFDFVDDDEGLDDDMDDDNYGWDDDVSEDDFDD